jgi:hypothetical protein
MLKNNTATRVFPTIDFVLPPKHATSLPPFLFEMDCAFYHCFAPLQTVKLAFRIVQILPRRSASL